MPATPTPRLKLPLPAESDPADVPLDLSKLATPLDAAAVVFTQGAFSTRPSVGTQGRLFYATDGKTFWWDDGTTWQQIVPLAITQSALPSGAVVGQEIRYLGPGTSAWWHLRYNGTTWDVMGGTPLAAYLDRNDSTSSSAYADLGGPQVTLPLAGDYTFDFGFTPNGSPSGQWWALGAPKFGAATPSDNDAATAAGPGGAAIGFPITRSIFRTGQTAGEVVALQYRTAGLALNFSSRWLRAMPVSVH
jgi:hypothetical protein